MTYQPKTQFYVTLPSDVKADLYDILVDIDCFGHTTRYEYGCGFDQPASPRYKAEALLACVKEVTELSMAYQQVLDFGVFLDDDNLPFGGDDGDDA